MSLWNKYQIVHYIFTFLLLENFLILLWICFPLSLKKNIGKTDIVHFFSFKINILAYFLLPSAKHTLVEVSQKSRKKWWCPREWSVTGWVLTDQYLSCVDWELLLKSIMLICATETNKLKNLFSYINVMIYLFLFVT